MFSGSREDKEEGTLNNIFKEALRYSDWIIAGRTYNLITDPSYDKKTELSPTALKIRKYLQKNIKEMPKAEFLDMITKVTNNEVPEFAVCGEAFRTQFNNSAILAFFRSNDKSSALKSSDSFSFLQQRSSRKKSA